MYFIYEPNRIALANSKGIALAEVIFPKIDAATVEITHTYVDDSLQGQGIAGQLMLETAKQLRLQNKKALLTCSYAKNWFEKRREEYSDILAD